ncbi:MAG: response regulator [Candidatus Parcubacteria bacterium]|nr:MAG: response regulator [Candidatus Parcubacteria bacterium]
MKILLVDDDKFLSRVLEKKLSYEGFEVITAIDGDEALEKVITEKPDLILLDIILPKKGGFVILENIKKDPELKQLPVLIISNLGQEEDVKKGLSLGAAEYFVKAKVSIDDIIKKVKEYAKDKVTN